MANQLPDLKDLFGSLDLCECEDCRSVLSPAAYLVDILQFLDDSARQRLFERRPDLGEIQLSCQNTNTLMPYIDLSNEVLENAISAPKDWPQTTWTAEELSANPEHVNDDVYQQILAQRVYPWDLPFDLAAEEARVYLEQLGVRRDQLMEAFQKDEGVIAGEYLHMTPLEQSIITGAAPNQPWEYWYDQKPLDGLTGLQAIPTFIKQSGLAYPEVLELLGTHFINPGKQNSILVEFTDDTCNLDTAKFSNQLLETIGPTLNQIHRFVRLRRKLGWTTRELDKTITALQPGELTATFLLQLSYIMRLRAEMDVSLVSMLSWWASLDTGEGDNGEPSLYGQLFQNKAVLSLNENEDVFRLNVDKSELLSTNEQITAHIPSVIAGLGISAVDLSLLINKDVAQNLLQLDHAELVDSTLNLANLTHLYRIVSLAAALQLSIQDFMSLKALSGIKPFDHIEDTRRFVEMARKVSASGFSIAELNYLLRHVYQEADGIAPSEQSITLILHELQAGLQKISTDTAGVTDPTGDLVRAKLATLFTDPQTQAQLIADAMGVIDGSSVLNDDDRSAFIDKHFAIFFGDTTDAKKDLVGTDALPNKADRFKFVLQAYLQWSLSEAFVKQKLGTALKLETAIMDQLLKQAIRSPRSQNNPKYDPERMSMAEFLDPEFILNTAKLDVQIDTFIKIQKAVLVIKKLKLTPSRLGTLAEPSWFVQYGPGLGWLDLNALPLKAVPEAKVLFGGWTRLLDLFSLWNKLPRGTNLYEIFEIAPTDKAGLDSYFDLLSKHIGWAVSDLKDLAGDEGLLSFVMPNDYKDEQILLRLKTCFDLISRLGLKLEQIKPWLKAEIDPTEVGNIREAVKAKYDQNQWLAIAKPLRDVLRQKQRTALVSYLVAHPVQDQTWQDGNGLFAYFLIDVEMNACMVTSRIKQAISSVQLFVQRDLMNLETGTLSAEQAQQWTTWMKSYRVWEANRKVFLYPENWIEPTLRDDKTPFFKELENRLLQGAVTMATAEDAFLSYLEKLDAVARLEIVGMYHETEQDTQGNVTFDTLHVFGRTWETPHIYYYRQLLNGPFWTAWEKVDVDIQGDHLIPVVWNRRLHLFWPIFTEKQVPQTDTESAKDITPEKYLEIQIAWSEYKNNRWSAKKVSLESESLSSYVRYKNGKKYMNITYKGSYVFKALVEKTDMGSEDLFVQCIAVKGGQAIPGGYLTSAVGGFQFSGYQGRVHVQSLDPRSRVGLLDQGDTYFDYMTFKEADDWKSLILSQQDMTNSLILQNTPSTFRVLYPHQYPQFYSQDSFFYEDDNRTFFVQPKEVEVVWGDPDAISLGAIDIAKAMPYEQVNLAADPVLPARTGEEPPPPVEFIGRNLP